VEVYEEINSPAILSAGPARLTWVPLCQLFCQLFQSEAALLPSGCPLSAALGALRSLPHPMKGVDRHPAASFPERHVRQARHSLEALRNGVRAWHTPPALGPQVLAIQRSDTMRIAISVKKRHRSRL